MVCGLLIVEGDEATLLLASWKDEVDEAPSELEVALEAISDKLDETTSEKVLANGVDEATSDERLAKDVVVAMSEDDLGSLCLLPQKKRIA